MTYKHGTTNGYTNHGCRCQPCRDCMSRTRREKIRAVRNGVPDQCEACGYRGKLQWDHDHPTSTHRGWLCRDCNRALGMFQDSPARLEAAIRYLEVSR